MVLFTASKRQKDQAGLNAELNSDFQYIKKNGHKPLSLKATTGI